MKRKWIKILAVLLLAGTITGERLTKGHARSLKKQKQSASERLEELRLRTLNAEQEKNKYRQLADMAQTLGKTVCLEPDSTNILRWFAGIAAELNLGVQKSWRHRSDHDQSKPVIIEDAIFETIRYSFHVTGPYGALVKCVARIERSPHVMVIEGLSLETNSEDDGLGQLEVTVTCLFPRQPSSLAQAEKIVGK